MLTSFLKRLFCIYIFTDYDDNRVVCTSMSNFWLPIGIFQLFDIYPLDTNYFPTQSSE